MVLTSHLKSPRSLAAHVCLTLFNSAFLRLTWPYRHSMEHKETSAKYQSCCLLLFLELIFFLFFFCGRALLRFSSLVTVMVMRSEGRPGWAPQAGEVQWCSASLSEKVATPEIGENPQWARGVPSTSSHFHSFLDHSYEQRTYYISYLK